MKNTLKKALVLIMAFTFVFGCAPFFNLDNIAFAAATEYTDGDFTFTVNNSLATITEYNGNSEIVEVPAKISDGEFEYPVTAIGKKAFAGCEAEKVVFPESVKSLGYGIFSGSSVADVTIKGRIESVGTKDSFSVYGPFNESKVVTVTMEQSNVPTYMFSGCTTLETVVLPESIKNANDNIGCYAFYNCVSLVSVNIPVGITKLGGVGAINMGYTFGNCESLESIVIPNTVKSVVEFAFAGCKSLNTVTFPESISKLGGGLFENSGVTEVIIKGRITEAETTEPTNYRGPFYGSKVTTVTMEQSNIPTYMFSGCTTLETVVLPEATKSTNDNIGCYAFYNCISLESIVIPEGITRLGKVGWIELGYTFGNCQSLESIVIPSSVNYIAKNAFYGCSNLQYIHFNTDNCEYSTLCDTLSTILCTSVAENPLELTVCEHNFNNDEPDTPDVPEIPDIPETTVEEKVSSNGIKVEYDSSYFENNGDIVLVAEEKEGADGNIGEYDENRIKIKRYDIHLERDGEVITSNKNNTEYTVKIPVPAGYERYTQFLIRHRMTLADGSTKNENIYAKVENGYIVFKTKSFSYFDICDFGFEKDSVALDYKSVTTLAATKISDSQVTYTSSNPKVVTVNENGNITTHGRGTATITATYEFEGGEIITDTCNVTVNFTFIQWIIYILLLGFLWY